MSGGQQQRIGVARALAADPPVLLMDEPFGAVDPITRLRLQDELLRLQEELRKTIVFVTHDFDEAVKLGDRIAILQAGSKIEQYDSPERILAEPANDFVRSFVGAGAALKQLTLTRVRDVDLHEAAVARVGGNTGEAIAAARIARPRARHRSRRPGPAPTVAVLGGTRTIRRRWTASHATRNWSASTSHRRSTTPSTLMLTSSHGVVVVTGRRNTYQGVIRVETIMDAMEGLRRSGEKTGSAS